MPTAVAELHTRQQVLVDIDRLTIDRDRFMGAMLEANIGIGLHFPAVHLQPYYLKAFGCRRGTFSPSRRQMRSTRLAFTRQPCARSSAVIRR